MASTKTKSESDDAMSDAEDEETGGYESSRPQLPASDGFFHIYKKGQGYWTRMGTVAGAGLIGLFTGNEIYKQASVLLTGKSVGPFMERIHLQDPRGPYLIVLIFALLYSLLVYYLMNKPAHADFLIATDSEMKKVNWTTQKELTGSTKIVIWFVFLMAVVLFSYDLFFQTLFYLLGVLKTPPLFLGH
jgi:preprotein translocase SecE subunit